MSAFIYTKKNTLIIDVIVLQTRKDKNMSSTNFNFPYIYIFNYKINLYT